MRNSDPTINATVPCAVCYDFGISEIIGVVSLISTAVSVTTGLIGASQQASAMRAQAAAQEAQARQAQQIAAYNAQIQRQNAEVAYQMAVYQSQSNQQLAAVNAAAAASNAAMAQVQGVAARQQYEQGIENAKQQEIQAEATRAQGREQARRQREENAQKMAVIRSKYGVSGVSFEGSPLVVLADAARYGETAVQDIAYVSELQSRKELREGQIERFKAQFSLIDEMGFSVEAQNLRNQVTRYDYEGQLAKYDTAIAGAKYRIGLNEARLTEIAGAFQAYGYESAAQQSRMQASASLISGVGGAIGSGLSGIAETGYRYNQMKRPTLYSGGPSYGRGYGAYGTTSSDYFAKPAWAT